jgi:hypothetical protein
VARGWSGDIEWKNRVLLQEDNSKDPKEQKPLTNYKYDRKQETKCVDTDYEATLKD